MFSFQFLQNDGEHIAIINSLFVDSLLMDKNCYRIPKATVQRRLEQNNRNSTTYSDFKANSCLKVHNAHLKLASPISG